MKWMKLFGGLIAFLLVFVLSTSLTIRLSLKDAPVVSCPDITGLDYDEAKRVGEEAGLSVIAVKWEIKKDVPYNRVVLQKPDAGVSVREGRTVSVVLADGPKPTTIPRLTGLSVEEAQDELQARGMPLKKILYVPGAPTGKIVAQSPTEGEGILGEGGMVLIAAGREKRFFVMPEISPAEVASMLRELDKKEIKYNLNPAAFADLIGETGPKARMTPRTIFNEDAVVELPAGPAGGGL